MPATTWVHYATSCNTQCSVPEDGKNNCPKHVELTGIINKSLWLHLVGCLYYFYQWRMVKQISDRKHKLDTCSSFCEHPTSDAIIKILSGPFSHACPVKLLQAFWPLSATKNCLMTSNWRVWILRINPNMSSYFPSLPYIHKHFRSNSFNVKIKPAMAHPWIYLTT